MADFFQTGAIATLHRLGEPDLGRLERNLTAFAATAPIALVLPCHVRELGSPALPAIVRTLREVPYLRQIVVGLDGATTAAQFRKARRTFADLPQETAIIWNDGPRVRRLLAQLATADLPPGPTGKGRNLWLAFGQVMAGGVAKTIAVHDCDILTDTRTLLARLCYPVAHPRLGFDFAKGYSARFTDRLNGRVMRLLFTPFVRSLESILGVHPFVVYLDTFRYPLAGEIAMDVDVARRIRMPADWGVEIGMLAEVFRNCAPKGICQIDVADRYDHKHQELSVRDATKGLHKMSIDIVRCVFRTLAAQGTKLDRGFFDTLLSAYLRKADDTMRYCAADAEINGLVYDRHSEEQAVAVFVRGIRAAAEDYVRDPLGEPFIPDWNRVDATLPNFLDDLRGAVAADSARG